MCAIHTSFNNHTGSNHALHATVGLKKTCVSRLFKSLKQNKQKKNPKCLGFSLTSKLLLSGASVEVGLRWNRHLSVLSEVGVALGVRRMLRLLEDHRTPLIKSGEDPRGLTLRGERKFTLETSALQPQR